MAISVLKAQDRDGDLEFNNAAGTDVMRLDFQPDPNRTYLCIAECEAWTPTGAATVQMETTDSFSTQQTTCQAKTAAAEDILRLFTLERFTTGAAPVASDARLMRLTNS